ncbi:hypothetical protein M0638_17305 [Roseomonas sp. NAR14]|uniref:General stress protein 17M-like domain-containing protein n=1 Tax=Roseomonas acroporae TaxID=2937791 RepID=A0A9X2BYK8_9PROT|nr:hypothetical protein [Roseomonas acroporae]MCK8786135.1 hypothetical protein [Roseomonas acroporae]
MATRTIARIFDNHADAEAAVGALEAAGFPHDDISVIASNADNRYRTDAPTGTAADTVAARPGTDPAVDRGDTAEAAETGAGTGATIGTVLGGGAGLLAGLGLLAIPGVGPVVAAGWLVATLAGAGVGAAAGGLLGGLTGAGISETDAHVYAEGVRRGGNLVTVRTEDSRAAEAESILARYNPVDTAARGAEYRAGGWTGYDPQAPVKPASGAPDGTPGNPPGTAATRALDRTAGTNVSGAYPEQSDGTPRNPPGTAAERALDRTIGTNTSGANPQHGSRV